MHIVAMFVTENLHFNMTRARHILLQDHVIITEALHTLALCSIKLIHEFGLIVHDTHAFATAT